MNTYKGTNPETAEGCTLPEGCPNMHKELDCPHCLTGTLDIRATEYDIDKPSVVMGEYLECIDCGCRYLMAAETLIELGDM